MPVLLGIASIFIFIFMVNIGQRLLQKQVSRATASFAENLGFSFTIEQSPAEPEVPGNYLLFAQGSPHSRRNVMEGQYKGVYLSVYEYTFVKAMDRFEESFVQTVVQIKTNRTTIPDFSLCPRDQLNAIMINMPTQESRDLLIDTAGIRLTHHPDFRNHYKLMGFETQQIQRIFDNDTIMNALETLEKKPFRDCVCLEGYGQTLLMYPLYKRIPLKAIRDFMDKCIDLSDQIEAALEE